MRCPSQRLIRPKSPVARISPPAQLHQIARCLRGVYRRSERQLPPSRLDHWWVRRRRSPKPGLQEASLLAPSPGEFHLAIPDRENPGNGNCGLAPASGGGRQPLVRANSSGEYVLGFDSFLRDIEKACPVVLAESFGDQIIDSLRGYRAVPVGLLVDQLRSLEIGGEHRKSVCSLARRLERGDQIGLDQCNCSFYFRFPNTLAIYQIDLSLDLVLQSCG